MLLVPVGVTGALGLIVTSRRLVAWFAFAVCVALFVLVLLANSLTSALTI